MKFIHIKQSNLEYYKSLFNKCFPKASHFNTNYLQWLYYDNPLGSVVGFDCWSDDEIVAHYACIPTEYLIEGTRIKCLLSLNTATAPSYQGRGLFTELARRTYDHAASQGYQLVIGVANSNSTPGFIKKLDFTIVKPLDVFLTMPRLMIQNDKPDFVRFWNEESLSWRISNPVRKYIKSKTGNIYAPNLPWGASVISHTVTSASNDRAVPLNPVVTLFIGFSNFRSPRVKIPERLRPSPLNFIYKPLKEKVYHFKSMIKQFDFLDFDAY